MPYGFGPHYHGPPPWGPNYDYELDGGSEYDPRSPLSSSESDIGSCDSYSTGYSSDLSSSSATASAAGGREEFKIAFRMVYADEGAYYPCSQKVLDEVQHLCNPNHDDRVGIEDAVADAIWYNRRKPDSERDAAIDRLGAAMTRERKKN